MRYIGFDMGDGESAVAVFGQGSGIEPMIEPIGGSRSLLSAVGKVRGEIVVGERAYTDVLAENLSVRFKSRFTYDPSSYDSIVLFVKGVLAALKERGGIHDDDVFVVGCPAGWNAACRSRYHDLLVRAGMQNPQVISESRAAFLYVKYAKTVSLDIDVLRESALVIDMGSSTLDFAYIVDGRETGVGIFGEMQLGGGLLDEEILRRAVQKSKNRNELMQVFEKSKSWYSYSEIEARRLKEQYFTQAAIDPKASAKKQIRVCYDGTQKLLLEMNAIEESSLVDDPLAALGGQSFSEALQKALDNAKQVTAGQPPRVVVLTGGASKMRFFQAQCRDTFPDAVVVCCPEPEFSIAKGLAYAGWIDENMRAFRSSIAVEITDERVADIAKESLRSLIPGVVDALTELVLEEAAIPIAEQWKSGAIDTLEEMNQHMQNRMERVLKSDLAEDALSPVIEHWLKGLNGNLQAMIDPICDRYQVPRKEMQLSFVQTGEAGKFNIGAKELLRLNFISAVVGVVLGVVGGLLCGGSGIALIAVGPLGFLAGAVIGAVVAAIGFQAVSGLMMKAKLPRPLRWMDVGKRLRSETTKRGLTDALSKEIGAKDSEFSKQVVKGFTDSFQKYLRQVAQAAEIPIQ